MEDIRCFLCGDPFQDVKKLKFHLVLVHPKSHVCLSCLEKKGWSDEFPTQVAYNEHYTKCHSGVSEERAEERQRVRLEQKQRQAERRRQAEALKNADSDARRLEQ